MKVAKERSMCVCVWGGGEERDICNILSNKEL